MSEPCAFYRGGERAGHVWKKRLSDEDAAALRADMKAAIEAAKIHGMKFPMARLVAHVGMSQPFIYNILTGKANGTLPTSVKIRDALRAMLAEAPGGDATTRAGAIALATSMVPRPALPPGRLRASPSPETVSKKRRNYAALLAEQAPLRERLQAYRVATGLSQRELAKQVGIGESSMSYFFTGKALKAPAYRKSLRFIERHEPALARLRGKEPALPAAARKRERAEETAALVQQRLPFDHARGSVIAVAAAMHPMHRSQPAPMHDGTAQQIAKDFVLKLLGGNLGIEAIEALIQIAKTNNE